MSGVTQVLSAIDQGDPHAAERLLPLVPLFLACGLLIVNEGGEPASPEISAVTNNGPVDISATARIHVEAIDPDGSADQLRYSFDCDDDGLFEIGPQSSSETVYAFGMAGNHVVNVKVEDADNGLAEAGTIVTVTAPTRDSEAPSLELPDNQIAEATSPDGARVFFSPPTAVDGVDGLVPIHCSRDSGSIFGLGETSVTCSASDSAGNTGLGSFSVPVIDTTPPQLTLPNDLSVEATGPGGAQVRYSATAVDLVSGLVPVECSVASPDAFPLGQTQVNCTATDDASNRALGQFSVRVKDSSPPTIQVPVQLTLTATDASGAVVQYEATAFDVVDGTIPTTCVPASGSVFAIGDTAAQCSATDSAGNTQFTSFPVRVLARDEVAEFEICPTPWPSAGNVKASLSGETLRIQGDTASNCLRVEPAGNGRMRVSGLNGTRVNGRSAFVTRRGVHNLYIKMNGDGDAVELVDLVIDGFFDAHFNRGNDTLALRNVEARGRTTVRGGNQQDTILVDRSRFAGSTIVNLRSGNDQLYLRSSDLADHGSDIKGGRGIDTFCMPGAQIQTLARPTAFERYIDNIDACLSSYHPDAASTGVNRTRSTSDSDSTAAVITKRVNHSRR